MVETLSVSLSGPAFSLLLYENVRNEFDQEGFLLGEVVATESNNITDNDEQLTKIDRVIRINSAVPFPTSNYIYDGSGAINRDKIEEFLGEDALKVVAWYKFKRVNIFKLTLREKVVYKQLADYFGTSPQIFTCCLLTAQSSPNGSTHTYSQTFLRYYEKTYQTIPMHIVNLSDPKNAYKPPEPSSTTFNNIVKALNIEKKHGVKAAMSIHQALQKHTEGVVAELTVAEKRLQELEREVRMLTDQIQDKSSREEATHENGDASSNESSPEMADEWVTLRKLPTGGLKKDTALDNIIDHKTRSKKSYSQVAQKK